MNRVKNKVLSKARRVVVTGIGVVSSQGIGVKQFWDNIIQGRSRVDRISFEGLNSQKIIPYGAEIKNFKFQDHIADAGKYDGYLDRGLEFGMVAAKEAYDDSNIGHFRNQLDNNRFGIYVGSTTGGLSSVCKITECYVQSKNSHAYQRQSLFTFNPGLWPLILADYFRTSGPAKAFSISCCAGGESIGQCFRDIKFGDIDSGICGGCDAPIVLINYLSFHHIKATSRWKGDPKEACRPFSHDRCGMVFGEGAAFLVLETLEMALARKAKIYGEIIGYSATGDGYNAFAPKENASEWSRAIQNAIKEASIEPKKIGCISCHGTGTKLNDMAETLAIKKAFGKHAYKMAAGSIKSMIGHSFGAATAIETVSLLKTLQTGVIPPTINHAGGDGDCDLDYVPNEAKKSSCEYGLKTATGFGGSNLALIISKNDWAN
jgi:3-oxoacyl-(acyl-carrier-protein) synthase